VKGADGDLFDGFLFILFIVKSDFEQSLRKFSASLIDSNLSFKSALNSFFSLVTNTPVVFKDLLGTNAFISFSLSTTNLTATD